MMLELEKHDVERYNIYIMYFCNIIKESYAY